MIGEVIALLLSLVLFCTAIAFDAIAVPGEHATCPAGMYVDGVRPSGETSCVANPPPGCEEPVGAWYACPEPRRFPTRIRCTGGSHPIVVDERTVGCTR